MFWKLVQVMGILQDLRGLPGFYTQAWKVVTQLLLVCKVKDIRLFRSYVPPLPTGIKDSQICFMLHVIEHMKGAAEASQLISQIRTVLDDAGFL